MSLLQLACATARVVAPLAAAVWLAAVPGLAAADPQRPGASGAAEPAMMPSGPLPAPDTTAQARWVLMSRGNNHLIFADVAASRWTDGAVSTRLLVYHALGVLGPQRGGHFRLEDSSVDCATAQRSTSASWLMGPDLTVLAAERRLLANEEAEPEQVWHDVGQAVCGLHPPRARAPVPEALGPALAAEVQSVRAALANRPLPRYLALSSASGSSRQLPVVASIDRFFLASENDCAEQADGTPVQVRAGQWQPRRGEDGSTCPNSDFTREVDLLSVFLSETYGTLTAAANKAMTDRPARPARPAAAVERL
jgi:hypothetical protein